MSLDDAAASSPSLPTADRSGGAVRRGACAMLAAVALLAAACGGGASPHGTTARGAPTRPAAPATATASPQAATATATASGASGATSPAAASVQGATAMPPLPVALDAESAVAVGSRIYVIGGIDPAGTTRAEIYGASMPGGRWQLVGRLPVPTHDAAAVALDGMVDVFGGGVSVSTRRAWRFDPATGKSVALPQLPWALSDAGAAVVGGTVYIVGGWDSSHYRNEILAWRPGQSTYRVAARLPAGLRYAAVTALDGRVIVCGGITTAGVSADVYAFTPGGGGVRRVGTLPEGMTYALAAPAPAGGGAWILGGLSHRGPLGAVLAFTGASPVRAGGLPAPVYYGAAVRVGGAVYVLGGKGADGKHTTDVWRLR